MFSKIQKLFCVGMVLLLGTMLIVSCGTKPDKRHISVDPTYVTANIGDNIEFSVSFEHFTKIPQQVTVTITKYSDNISIQNTLNIINGKISIPTSELSEGTYSCSIPYADDFGFWLKS